MYKLNPNIKKILLEVIKYTSSGRGRKLTYDVEHYLDVIYYVLQSDIKWVALKEKLHYDTYRKKFQYWCEQLHVFECAYSIICDLLDSNYYDHSKLKKLYMDSTDETLPDILKISGKVINILTF